MNKPNLAIKSWGKGSVFISMGTLSLVLAGATFATEQNSQQQDAEAARQQPTQSKQQRLYRVSKLRDREVQNTAEEQLGSISEIVIDKSGQVRYAVLSHGGTLGMNEKMTALPWDVLQISERGKYYTLDVSEEELADAPTFSDDDWPIQPMWDINPGSTTTIPPAER